MNYLCSCVSAYLEEQFNWAKMLQMKVTFMIKVKEHFYIKSIQLWSNSFWSLFSREHCNSPTTTTISNPSFTRNMAIRLCFTGDGCSILFLSWFSREKSTHTYTMPYDVKTILSFVRDWELMRPSVVAFILWTKISQATTIKPLISKSNPP